MSVGTQFASPLKLNGGTLQEVYGPFSYDDCLAINVLVVQTQTELGEGAIAAASMVAASSTELLTTTSTAGKMWNVPLTALSTARPFKPGLAQATASALVRDNGVERVVEWSHAVEVT
jgi:hypothetical protein